MEEGGFAVLLAATHTELLQAMRSIETALWLLVGIATAAFGSWWWNRVQRGRTRKCRQADWQDVVQRAYDQGNYVAAQETLATVELLFPRSALVKYWQGRCHFQLEQWQSAAEKFEASLRLEPGYRRSVRDYMAFMELNSLAPGVQGYLDSRDND